MDTTQFIFIGVGVMAGYGFNVLFPMFSGKNASKNATEIINDAEDKAKNIKREADNFLKEAKLSAKDEKIKIKEEFEKETKERRQELLRQEKRLEEKENNQERKLNLLEKRTDTLDNRESTLKTSEEKVLSQEKRLEKLISEQVENLERVAGMTQQEGKTLLLKELQRTLDNERGAIIRRHSEEVRRTEETEAKEILAGAIQRYVGDCTYERTTAAVQLPSDEMKGRIIGRDGRNIKVIESLTGASLLVDDTPETVLISCFDPLRKEVARQSLERLIIDGRIHPTKIEETITKVRKEIDNDIIKVAEEVVDNLNLDKPVNKHLLRLLGQLKFRYSYSQNVLQHSIEVARMMGMIAAELKLDVSKAKRMGLFHDIGKAIDHEVDGSHATIGADVLRRAGEDKEVINGVASHHEDEPPKTPLAILVNVCDTISAGRPGARSETTEFFIKRLEKLEEIASSYKGVDECYAVQGGRELRIIINSSKRKENEAAALAHDIVKRVEKEVKYPGQIKVTIIRETRAVEYAK
ncbi:MAG: ribonuclease Y [Verrucomicrobiota bacterium]|nr:ribonuclease Y [Verrucomicrobiota bacterium]